MNRETLLQTLAPLFAITFFILLIANVLWGFRDGRKRGLSGILVALLVTCSFPLGVFIWLLLRPGIPEAAKFSEDPDDELKRRANAGTL